MNDDTLFTFVMNYAGEQVRSDIRMEEASYKVSFDYRQVANIAMDDNEQWILTGGLLPIQVVELIGQKIESYYS